MGLAKTLTSGGIGLTIGVWIHQYVRKHATVEREERGNSSVLRLTWQEEIGNREKKDLSVQKPSETAVRVKTPASKRGSGERRMNGEENGLQLAAGSNHGSPPSEEQPGSKCGMKTAESPNKCSAPKEPQEKCQIKAEESPNKCGTLKENRSKCTHPPVNPGELGKTASKCPMKEPEGKCSMQTVEPSKKMLSTKGNPEQVFHES